MKKFKAFATYFYDKNDFGQKKNVNSLFFTFFGKRYFMKQFISEATCYDAKLFNQF